MLEELTPSQVAALGPHLAKWIGLDQSTDPIDRPRARAAVELAYACAGLKAPAQFVWCQSPLAMDLAYRLAGGKPVGNELNVYSEVQDAVYHATTYTVWDAVRDSVFLHSVCTTATIINHNPTSVQDSIWSGVSDSLWEADLGDRWDRDQLLSQDPDVWCYGQHDAYWLSHYSFFREECGLVSETAKLVGVLATAHECGWWIPCESMVFVSSRPSYSNVAATVYGDGFRM